MWTENKSLILSKCCTLLFMAVLAAAAVFAPRLVAYLTYVSAKAGDVGHKALFLVTIYAGCIPAAVLLVSLYGLLRRIGAGCVFVRENTDGLRRLSWCCFTGAVICGASAFYYVPWSAVAVAAAFMGLILRVLRNVIAKAVSLQDDAEFTV